MKYIGNTGTLIDWNLIIESLRKQSPAHTGPDNSLEDPGNMIGFQEIMDKWNSVGVKTVSQGGTNNWEMYLPTENFDNSVIDTFSNYVKADTLFAWIANIHPGCMAHWHWDTSSKEDMFDNIVNIVRYSCFITKPHPGHVFMTSTDAIGYVDQGDIYQWPDRKAWHGGINFGFEEKYTLHFIGTKK